MSNKTISDLNLLETISDDDVLLVETSTETMKTTKSNLLKEVSDISYKAYKSVSKKSINIIDLGAIPNDSTFNNTEIIQFAIDNYDNVIMDDLFYTDELVISKPTTINSINATLRTFSNSVRSILKVDDRLTVHGRLNIYGNKQVDYCIYTTHLERSYIEELELSGAKIWGMYMTGKSHFARIGIIRCVECGSIYECNYTKKEGSNNVVVLDDFADIFNGKYTFITPMYATLNKTATADTGKLCFPIQTKEQYELSFDNLVNFNSYSGFLNTGTITIYLGGGICLAGGGDNGNVNFDVVNCILCHGSGIETSGLYGIHAQYLSFEYCGIGITTKEANQCNTCLFAYFEHCDLHLYCNQYNNFRLINTIQSIEHQLYNKDYVQRLGSSGNFLINLDTKFINANTVQNKMYATKINIGLYTDEYTYNINASMSPVLEISKGAFINPDGTLRNKTINLLINNFNNEFILNITNTDGLNFENGQTIMNITCTSKKVQLKLFYLNNIFYVSTYMGI